LRRRRPGKKRSRMTRHKPRRKPIKRRKGVKPMSFKERMRRRREAKWRAEEFRANRRDKRLAPQSRDPQQSKVPEPAMSEEEQDLQGLVTSKAMVLTQRYAVPSKRRKSVIETLSQLEAVVEADGTGSEDSAPAARRDTAQGYLSFGNKRSKRRNAGIESGASNKKDGPEKPVSKKVPVKRVTKTTKVDKWRLTNRGMAGLTVGSSDNLRDNPGV